MFRETRTFSANNFCSQPSDLIPAGLEEDLLNLSSQHANDISSVVFLEVSLCF